MLDEAKFSAMYDKDRSQTREERGRGRNREMMARAVRAGASTR